MLLRLPIMKKLLRNRLVRNSIQFIIFVLIIYFMTVCPDSISMTFKVMLFVFLILIIGIMEFYFY